MINIFYHPIYHLSSKKLFTFEFKKSLFLNIFIRLAFIFNMFINDNLITSGPHKRMNNLIKTFRNDKRFIFNKLNYRNSYLVQFDKYGEKILKKLILKYSDNQKILIGPLYDLRYEDKLNKYIKDYPFIKKVVASQKVYESQLYDLSFDNSQNQLVVMPSGVIEESKLLKDRKNIEQGTCLIYFKNRKKDELDQVIKLVESKGIKPYVLSYGKYSNSDLLRISRKVEFGIILTGTESQGFAIQDLMANNLPLFVWDKTVNYYEDLELRGTSVSFWDDRCGMIVSELKTFENNLDDFYINLDKFSPVELIREELTFEVFKKNLLEQFKLF